MKPAHYCHVHGVVLEPLAECAVMLLRQNRGRDQHSHLLTAGNGLKRCPNRNLRFPITHIAAQQAIHWPRLFHILLDLSNGCKLIGRFLVGEQAFEVVLPGIVGGIGKTGYSLPLCIQLQKAARQLFHRLLGPLFCSGPFTTAEFGKAGRLIIEAYIALEEVDLIRRQVQAVLARVFDEQVILFVTAYFHSLHTEILADPVVDVHHIIAFFKVCLCQAEALLHLGGLVALGAAFSVQLQIRVYSQLKGRKLKACFETTSRNQAATHLDIVLHSRAELSRDFIIAQQFH